MEWDSRHTVYLETGENRYQPQSELIRKYHAPSSANPFFTGYEMCTMNCFLLKNYAVKQITAFDFNCL